MKSIDSIESNDGRIYNGNGVSLRINERAFKCTINYKHASEERKEKVKKVINENIFDLIKDFMFVEK